MTINIVSEISEVERRRAEELTGNPIFNDWVQSFREKYIVKGFLSLIYAGDGRYSRPKNRVSKFGNYILTEEMAGIEFQEHTRGWVKNEEMWFWFYLTDGQEIISPKIPSPEVFVIDGIPATLIWPEIVALAKELQLFGETGGGIIEHPDDMEGNYPTKDESRSSWQEDDDGYMESYKLPDTFRWISLFKRYASYPLSPRDIEIRPAWFHMLNYAFFNAPIRKLPVFYCLFSKEGKMDAIRFFDDTLSDTARDTIGKAVLTMPIEMKEQLSGYAVTREKQEIIWWIMRNIGDKEKRRTLSWQEIADKGDTARSSVKVSVERFDRKLKENLDGKLLERLLLEAGSLGLGYNLTYNTLVKMGLVPDRERGIDSFDELDKLI